MKYSLTGLIASLDESDCEPHLAEKISPLLGINRDQIVSLKVIRRSLDARRHRPPFFVFNLELELQGEPPVFPPLPKGMKIERIEPQSGIKQRFPLTFGPLRQIKRQALRPVVVGSGPAGLFAALVLARQGMPPLILERGKMLDKRILDVEKYWRQGILDEESNIQFGEGGAGTFSDGKLTYRSNNPASHWIKKTLVELGAPEDILIDAKPHIGTDRLRIVLHNFRRHLIDLGCELKFGAKFTDLTIKRNKLQAIIVNDREEITVERLILAIGQSGRDNYELLFKRGVRLEARPFALGVRVEHPQAQIDQIQYGRWAGHHRLPPAEYVLKTKIASRNRYLYSFCMCPGGMVIGAASEAGQLTINGMSYHKRNSPWANSALLVNVRTEDYPGSDPLRGLSFRNHWERKAYALGGGNFKAPAQALLDFLSHRVRPLAHKSSFQPAVVPADLREALPDFTAAALREGIGLIGKMMPGFLSQEANLIGVETRTSSPVRITRGEDGQSPGLSGIFPCGEGAGYAGGIISSAIDGINAALNLRQSC